MARFKTFSNGGSLAPGDLNTMRDEIDAALGWRLLWQGSTDTWTTGGAQTLRPAKMHALGPQSPVTGDLVAGEWQFLTSTRAHVIIIENTPSPFRKPRLKYEVSVQFGLQPNGTAYGTEAVLALFPVIGQVHFQGLGEGYVGWKTSTIPVPGTAFNIGEPISSVPTRVVSNSFPLPQTGLYLLCAAVESDATVNSDLGLRASLLYSPGARND